MGTALEQEPEIEVRLLRPPSLPPLSEAERERVHHLWDELSAFPSSETDAALRRLFDAVGGWIGADDGQWISGVRPARLRGAEDYLLGWRAPVHRPWRPLGPAHLALFQELKRQRAAGPVDAGMTTHATVARAGTFRVHRLRDGVKRGFVDYAAFRKTPHYRLFYQSLGVADRIWVAFPLNADAESYFLFDRTKGGGRAGRRFTAREAALAAYALRGLRWFHLRLFLAHGLIVGEGALTPAQREVARHLLTGKSEKEIALALGQSPATTHKHVKAVYRAFGATSRAALMALWLAGG